MCSFNSSMCVRTSICRSLTKSQCSSLSTSIVPHGYARPRTWRPSGPETSLSEPTTANGILRWRAGGMAEGQSRTEIYGRRARATHEDLFVLGERLLVLHLVLRRLVDLDPVVRQIVQDPRLELRHFLVGQGIGLGDDGDEVHARMQPAHELDVQGFQAVGERGGTVRARLS